VNPYKAVAVGSLGIRAVAQEQDGLIHESRNWGLIPGLGDSVLAGHSRLIDDSPNRILDRGDLNFVDWPYSGPITAQALVGDNFGLLNGPTSLILLNAAGDRLLTAGMGKHVTLWKLPSWQVIEQLPGISKEEWVWSAAFSPDGNAVAAGGDGEAYISQIKAKRLRLHPISGIVGLVAFSLDTRYVFTRAVRDFAFDTKSEMDQARRARSVEEPGPSR
jgi:WD40 repeat protein